MKRVAAAVSPSALKGTPPASAVAAAAAAEGSQARKTPRLGSVERLELAVPDDWHHHLRDSLAQGDGRLELVAPHAASRFHRVIVMPNLVPPIKTCVEALAYRERILNALPKEQRETGEFNPLMTLYLTDDTPPSEIDKMMDKEHKGKIVAVKMYPSGATTNSHFGVTSIDKVKPVLRRMAELRVPLLVHGEVVDPQTDVFDREALFIETILKPLLQDLPALRVVLEHVTTKEAVDFVLASPSANLAATITPQHLLFDRSALFAGGLQPHYYCLPILKRGNPHRLALLAALKSDKFFLGTDSAPHARGEKEKTCGCAGCYTAPHALELYAQAFEEAGALEHFEAFASLNGPKFYGLPVNPTGKRVALVRKPQTVPAHYAYESKAKGKDDAMVPLKAGQVLDWSYEGVCP